MKEIAPIQDLSASVSIEGSKSYTHRLLIAAALSEGCCRIVNALRSEDTSLTMKGLRQMGVSVTDDGADVVVFGTKGVLKGAPEIFLNNSGTGMRFLTAVAALAEGRTLLTGSDRMQQRPISDLLDGLNQLGVSAKSINGTGCPPVEVIGAPIEGGTVQLKCNVSSQYLSALLLIAPMTRKGVTISVIGDPVSKPYVDLTLETMRRMGVAASRSGDSEFFVPGSQVYRSGQYTVEADASSASYFWAAAAIMGGRVSVAGFSENSKQGDLRILDCLEEMGCGIDRAKERITVTGGKLRAIDVDMEDMPDMVPTLAVVAAFAEGTTFIRNIAHLRLKESDRMTAVAEELGKMGIRVRCTRDTMEITGGRPRGADIDSHNDHRIAMSFSVAGLRTSGVRIMDETCVAKSFPTYWDLFNSLYCR